MGQRKAEMGGLMAAAEMCWRSKLPSITTVGMKLIGYTTAGERQGTTA